MKLQGFHETPEVLDFKWRDGEFNHHVDQTEKYKNQKWLALHLENVKPWLKKKKKKKPNWRHKANKPFFTEEKNGDHHDNKETGKNQTSCDNKVASIEGN